MELTKMNFNPKIWGGNAWEFLHTVALSYPLKPTNQDVQEYKNFFTKFGNILPCQKCQGNYNKHLTEIDIDKYLNSPFDLFSFVVKLQNIVARDTGADYEVNEEYLKGYYFAKNLNTINIPHFSKIIMFFILFFVIIMLQNYFKMDILYSVVFNTLLMLVALYYFEKYIYHYTFIPTRYIIFGICIISILIGGNMFYKKYFG